MIIRLWALAWTARYLKYVPILGWRFSESIVQTIEERMDRDVTVDDPTATFGDGRPSTALEVEARITNELPVDLTVSAVNIWIGNEDGTETHCNVLWSEDAHGSPPKNVTRSLIESESEETLRVERSLAGAGADEQVAVAGTIETRAWLDVPSTRRIPLGTLERAVPETVVSMPS